MGFFNCKREATINLRDRERAHLALNPDSLQRTRRAARGVRSLRRREYADGLAPCRTNWCVVLLKNATLSRRDKVVNRIRVCAAGCTKREVR